MTYPGSPLDELVIADALFPRPVREVDPIVTWSAAQTVAAPRPELRPSQATDFERHGNPLELNEVPQTAACAEPRRVPRDAALTRLLRQPLERNEDAPPRPLTPTELDSLGYPFRFS